MPTCSGHRPGVWLVLLLALLVAGCAATPGRNDPLQGRDFELGDVAKGDIDLVAEVTVQQARAYLRELAVKLYRRNPNQLRRAALPGLDVNRAVARLFVDHPVLPQLHGRRSAAAVELAFQPAFGGDRVAAFIFGLRSMTEAAYGGEGPFYLVHEFHPQKIYYLARNIEIAAWRLRHRVDAQGRPYLLSTGRDRAGTLNLGFARLFGKLIAVHDQFAQVVADSGSRRIKDVIQGVASAVFFPI